MPATSDRPVLQLPAIDVRSRGKRRTGATQSVPALGVPGTVLIVEDDPVEARVLADMMAVGGMSARHVGSVEEAMRVLERDGYDLLLLDLHLPDGPGLDLCRRVKDDPAMHHLPVIIVSGAEDPGMRIAALGAGADDYFIKPYLAAELLARAMAAVRTSRFNQELRRRRHALRSEVSLVRQWAQYVVHDLQNPLTAAVANLDFIKQRTHASDDGELVDAVGEVARELRRLQRMVHDLLDAERLAHGSLSIERAPVDLRALALEVAEEAAPMARSYGCAVQVEGEGQARGDGGLIERVLWNLLANAFKYASAGKQVRVVIGPSTRGPGIQVAVIDRGAGVPLPARQHLFTVYGRADDTGRPGYGIGLAFCRLAVEAHGGRIWIDDPPGGGAAFVFSLPPA